MVNELIQKAGRGFLRRRHLGGGAQRADRGREQAASVYAHRGLICPPQTNLDCTGLYNDLVSSTGHAVRHLHALGHRRIAFTGGSLQVGGSGARGQGFLAELRALGLPDDPAYHHEGGFDADSGERAVSRLLSGLERKEWPTALVAFNDLVALGAMRQLKQWVCGCPTTWL